MELIKLEWPGPLGHLHPLPMHVRTAPLILLLASALMLLHPLYGENRLSSTSQSDPYLKSNHSDFHSTRNREILTHKNSGDGSNDESYLKKIKEAVVVGGVLVTAGVLVVRRGSLLEREGNNEESGLPRENSSLTPRRNSLQNSSSSNRVSDSSTPLLVQAPQSNLYSYESLGGASTPGLGLRNTTVVDLLTLSDYQNIHRDFPDSNIVQWDPATGQLLIKPPITFLGIDCRFWEKQRHQATRTHFIEKMKEVFFNEVVDHAAPKKEGALTLGEVRESLQKAQTLTSLIENPSTGRSSALGASLTVTVQIPLKQTMQLNLTLSEETSHLVQSPLPQEVGAERLRLTRLESIRNYANKQEELAATVCEKVGTPTRHLQEASQHVLQGLRHATTLALNTVAIPLAVGAFSTALVHPFTMSASILVSHLLYLPETWQNVALATSIGVSAIAGGGAGYYTMTTLRPTFVPCWEETKTAFGNASASIKLFFEARTASQKLTEKSATAQATLTLYYQEFLHRHKNIQNLSSQSTDTANNSVAPVLAPSSINDTLSRCAPSTSCSSSVSAILKTGSHSDEVDAIKLKACTHLLTTWTPATGGTYVQAFKNFIEITNQIYSEELMKHVLSSAEQASIITKKKLLTKKRAEEILTQAAKLKTILDKNLSQQLETNRTAAINKTLKNYTAQKAIEAREAYNALTRNSPSPSYDTITEALQESLHGLKYGAPLMIRPLIGITVGSFVGAYTGFTYGEWHSDLVPSTLTGASWMALVGAGIGIADRPGLDILACLTNNRMTWPESSSPEMTAQASTEALAAFTRAGKAIIRFYQIQTTQPNIEENSTNTEIEQNANELSLLNDSGIELTPTKKRLLNDE